MKNIIESIKSMDIRTKLTAVAGIVGIVIIGTILILNMQPTKPKIELIKEEFIVEYGDPVLLKDESEYIKASEKVLKETSIAVSGIEYDDDKDYPKVGTYKATATYREEELTFKIVVKDTTAPEFVDFKETLELEKGNKDFDFISQYKAEDLSEVTITVDTSKVKFDEVGDYTIDVSATDKYENKTTKTATVKVTESVVVEGTDNPVVEEQPQSSDYIDPYVPNNNPVVDSTPAPTPQPSDPAPTTCNANGQWKQVGNSGVAFYNDGDARAYGWANKGTKWDGFDLIHVKDICGVEGWTVDFY